MTSVPLAHNFEDLLNRRDNIVIISHFNPDGDAIGSSVGMRCFLESRNCRATIVIPSRMPEFLEFLDPGKRIVCYMDDKSGAKAAIHGAGLIICLDFNKLERTEWLADELSGSSATKVLIDHHPNPERQVFDLVISDPAASSTCELLYRTLMCFSSVAS